MKVASFSVDVDSLHHYLRIHGHAAPALDDTVWRLAIPRFAALFAEFGVRATFFVVGEEAARNEGALKALVAAGHDVANHSYSHRYDLWNISHGEQRDELSRAHEALARASGVAPVGFRAPGYSVSESLLDVVRALGYEYDSSVFPSAPYYAAKAAVMAFQRLLRRPLGSSLGPAKVVFAPSTPYFPHPQDWRRRAQSGSVIEIPIPVVPPLGVPFIGTTILTMPTPAFHAIALVACTKYTLLNIELHAVELLDFGADSIDPRLARQPDLKVPLASKRRRLRDLVEMVRRDFSIAPLREAARLQRDQLAQTR